MKVKLGLVLIALVVLVGCPKLEENARDTSAALQGAINAAQTQYKATCQPNPNQNECQVINQAVSAQNALITATETYCGWNPSNPPADPKAKCVPVQGAEAGLNSAIANANRMINEVKGVIH